MERHRTQAKPMKVFLWTFTDAFKKETCPLLWLAIQTEDRQAVLTTFTTAKGSPLETDSQRQQMKGPAPTLWAHMDAAMPKGNTWLHWFKNSPFQRAAEVQHWIDN